MTVGFGGHYPWEENTNEDTFNMSLRKFLKKNGITGKLPQVRLLFCIARRITSVVVALP